MDVFLSIAGLVTLISNVIQYQYNDSDGFVGYLIDDLGWINILACVGGFAILAGFIFWSWKLMLLIVLFLIFVAIIIFLILYYINKDDEEDEENEEIVSQTKSVYKCKNCGASLLKLEVETGEDRKVVYKCEHCGISGTLKEIRDNKNEEEIVDSKTEIELSDFEEEYFSACETMSFRPHNSHTQKQIDRKYEKLTDMIYDGELSYDDDYRDDEDILDEAYDFFSENTDEIEEYLKETKYEGCSYKRNKFCGIKNYLSYL